jgi:chain length determinant protein EpsF
MRATEGKGNIRDWLAELLLEYLNVEPSRESTVVNISYTANDPRFAAAVANAVVQSYVNTSLELKVAPARQTNTFFNEQIKSLKENLEKVQASLSAYQREKGIIATDERLDVENNRLNELSTQLVTAQAQTYDAQTRQRQVQEAIARGEVPESVPDVVASPVIQQLKANLTALEAKLNDLSSKVGTNHPQYLAATAELQGVRNKLKDEMSTVAKTIGNNSGLSKRREDQIKASLEAQRDKVLQMKKVRDDLTVLLREVENAQRAYDAAMGRMTQTRLESQATQTNVLVINEAIEPIKSSSPKILLNTVLSIVLGLMLAVAFALLREMSDRVVRSETDLRELLGLPVLGVLSQQRRGWRRRGLDGVAAPGA